jgi:replication fork protection complex subunit Csm3/Swi3
MHDVFPKARFRDCIALTEKAGHQAQLRVKRKQWIDDTKPRREDDDEGDVEGLEVLQSMEREVEGILYYDLIDLDVERQDEDVPDAPVEDEPLFVEDESDLDLDDIMGSQEQNNSTTTGVVSGESATKATAGASNAAGPEAYDEFDEDMDELEAMREMEM